jgi:hypothetical protein
MKILIKTVAVVAAVGLVAGYGVTNRSLNCGRAGLPVGLRHVATYPCPDQLAAKFTDQFLNQLATCSVH